MLSQRQRLLIAAVLIAAPLLWWGLVTPDQSEPSSAAGPVEQVDFFIRNAEITRWQDDGSIGQVLTTPLMRHYPAREEMHLSTPEVQMPRGDGGFYLLNADEGTLPDSQEQILLAGNVQLHDNPTAGPGALMTTDRMTLYPPRDYAHTDDPVQMLRGTDTTSAVGMDLFFDQQRIELLSNVKGEYHVQ
ncbi:LPS export ABC transporter periplasmic protein LptC [Marinobacterium marinum]|uniref:LPS export ABC transporter periplasmic protein LptC n=1 Tax=Marinobacterium marinum TaxID=2756129 RepID=A0A7W1WZR5_9GAMM|nr:LPS export ABC transporter periplasmic protein LptC [Marinobacterium marinum]MBA4503119.1 LPS export ABC transporter periplasmic protein LptC [Marinobacterium marinum]